MLEARSFPRTTFVNEVTLATKIQDPNLISISLLGVIETKCKKKKKKKSRLHGNTVPPQTTVQLLYAATCHAPNQNINNVLQLAANILNESKVIFFSTLLFLETVLNPALACKIYADTDR